MSFSIYSRETSTYSRISTTTSASSTSTQNTFIFPSEFGIYCHSSSTTVLALTTKDPEPFASVYMCHGFRSKPDITMYQGRHKYYSQLASAQFKGMNGQPHITLGSTRFGEAPTEKLECEGFLQVVHHFSLYLESLQARERFEWRYCCRAELKTMGHMSGMKLVRVMTGDVVAVYAKVSCAMKKIGKMKFLTGNMLGNEFQVMAVMSLIAILEAERRSKAYESAASSDIAPVLVGHQKSRVTPMMSSVILF